MRIRLANPYLDAPDVRRWLSGGPTETRFPMNNDGGSSDDGAGDGGGGSTEDEDEDEEEDTGPSDAVKDKEKPVSREEFDAAIQRMKAADRRASNAESKLKEIADKDKSELEKATERVTQLEEDNKKLLEKLRFADLRDAFANVEGFNWRKPGSALKLARSEGYLDDVFGEDGEVDQKKVSKKVKEFAEANDYLLVTNGTGGGTPPPSGSPTGTAGRRKPEKQQQEDADLKKRYPILGR